MKKMSNIKLYHEIEKFVISRLRPFSEYQYLHEYGALETYSDVEDRLHQMNIIWALNKYRYEKNWGEFVYFPQLTNHEICHEMFWNAYRGRSKMYIQLPNLNSEENTFSNFLDRGTDINSNKGVDGEDVITLSCSLLTLQMLDYDIMMFRAMEDQEDKEYSDAARDYYRPYLFNFVAEIDQKTFNELQKIQKKQGQITLTDARDAWLACSFNPDDGESLVDLNGYVVQSASSINKSKEVLSIIEDDGTSVKVKKEILDNYKLKKAYVGDIAFMNELKCVLVDCLSSIYVYRIGNGNCIYAENKNKDMSFFFDIGFNHKHRPKKISPTSTYKYSSAMKKIFARDPSCFILSHWDLDHIAGSFAAKKDYLNKKWFAPNCHDACIDAQRLARYLDIKGNLFCAARGNGRRICEIKIGNNATYKLFMGEKVPCDNSLPNCEGIVIKYETPNKTVMMMGDVNYASYNMAIDKHNARYPSMSEPLFANTQIDYLIVPHHGSEHTDYNLIIDKKPIKMGTQAIICCTNVTKENRPNIFHKRVLKKRFKVSTTETGARKKDYIQILL